MATYSYCGNFPVIADSTIPQTQPTIKNITITGGDLLVEQSYAIPNGTKKLLLKHRNSGSIKFYFISGSSETIEIPKGSIYSENDLNLQNETLYYMTDKIGTIEILTWK